MPMNPPLQLGSLLLVSACSMLGAPKLIDTGIRSQSGSPTSTSEPSTTSSGSSTSTTDSPTLPSTTTTTSTSTSTTTTEAWRCTNGPAVPVELVPILNTCPVALGLDPTPWEIACGDPGEFLLRLGPTDTYPMACTWSGWSFECEGNYPTSTSIYEGVFERSGTMRGTVSTEVFAGASTCRIEYQWALDLV